MRFAISASRNSHADRSRYDAYRIGSVLLLSVLFRSLTSAQTPTPTVTPPLAISCSGDCDGSQIVTVNELVTMVNIALGRAELTACPAGRRDVAAPVTVNELVAAVAHSLRGCIPASPTATPGPFANGRCSETANCDPCDVYPCRPFSASREFCCQVARHGGSFSWCEVVDAAGFCAQCTSACANPRPTP